MSGFISGVATICKPITEGLLKFAFYFLKVSGNVERMAKLGQLLIAKASLAEATFSPKPMIIPGKSLTSVILKQRFGTWVFLHCRELCSLDTLETTD